MNQLTDIHSLLQSLSHFTWIIIIIDAVFVCILLSYFTMNVLVISSTVAADMGVSLCANVFTVEK